uniref:Uncharacterized protein n=1 Tax=Anguilla anguilla TaxID=7936 RepID=A0A0E9UQR3_ANGAN
MRYFMVENVNGEFMEIVIKKVTSINCNYY